MTERKAWVLPEPDSPTTPTAAPAAIAKLTSLTAATSPSGVAKRVVRSVTARTAADPGSRRAATAGLPPVIAAPDLRGASPAARGAASFVPIARRSAPGPGPARWAQAGCFAQASSFAMIGSTAGFTTPPTPSMPFTLSTRVRSSGSMPVTALASVALASAGS